ncbi:MAG TPA: cyanophycin synthetase, partial [Actinomycetota bacterium]|nr:cyanophycin synthetase [Actinomycetota bacterium]
SLGGNALPDDGFGDAFDHLLPYLDHLQDELGEELSYFEVLTAMFFLWAADQPVDAAVIEVGLGGRWDATNVVPTSVGVITNIDIDHSDLLGMEPAGIAVEKAGIIKPGATVVVGERRPDPLGVISSRAQEMGADLRLYGSQIVVEESRVALGGRYLNLLIGEATYESLFLPLHGSHQAINAALALAAVNAFLARPLSTSVVQEAFAAVKVPGRMETARVGGKPFVLDVAHNPAGMSAFVTGLIETFGFERACVVFGALSDKDHLGMLSELRRLQPELLLVQPQSERAVPSGELALMAKELGFDSAVATDLDEALTAAERSDADLVAITGSHYLVGEARSRLAELKAGRS